MEELMVMNGVNTAPARMADKTAPLEAENSGRPAGDQYHSITGWPLTKNRSTNELHSL